MEGKTFSIVGWEEGRERKLNFKKLKWKTTFPIVWEGRERERERERGGGNFWWEGSLPMWGEGGVF